VLIAYFSEGGGIMLIIRDRGGPIWLKLGPKIGT